MAVTLPAPHAALAGSASAESGPGTVALLELYTSEGCSSCPPADRFVSELVRSGPGPAALAVLAFHVDYWDYIGWKDPFASPAHGNRQRQIARRNGMRTVYTPQLVLNGLNFSAYRNVERAVGILNAVPARARLRIDARSMTGERLSVRASGSVDPAAGRQAGLYLALYENGLQREVKAGENRGRTLRHDRVVRRFLGPVAAGADGILELQQELQLDHGWRASELGLVAFVQDTRGGEVLQAVQLPLGDLLKEN